MTLTRSPRRRAGRLALTSLALVAPLLALATTTPPDAHAVEGTPTIELRGTDRVVAYSWEGMVEGDLGLRLRVTDAPLELWSQRASYQEGVTLTQKLEAGDVTFPADTTTSVGALTNFLRLKIVPVSNTAAPTKYKKLPGCFAAGMRFSPDGAFSSPYPGNGCYYNPYALGSVQGIPAGWEGSVIEPYSSTGLKLKPGKYQVKANIALPYATTLGIPNADGTVTFTLVVKEYDGECRGCRPRAPQARELTPEATEPKGPGVSEVEDLPEGTPLPDLRALPAFGIELNRAGTQLRFAANVWNNGNSDLIVDGFRRDGEDVMDAYQYFIPPEGGEPVAHAQVGTMEWDPAPTHEHWHFRDFATYELFDDEGVLATPSGKEAFCLANTDAVDLTAPGAKWKISYDDLGSVCGGFESQSIREVLAAGWGDTYAQFRAGQAFAIKDVPDGIYTIRVTANPDSNLIEATEDNNTSERTIRLFTNAKGVRKVKVFPVGVVVEPVWGERY